MMHKCWHKKLPSLEDYTMIILLEKKLQYHFFRNSKSFRIIRIYLPLDEPMQVFCFRNIFFCISAFSSETTVKSQRIGTHCKLVRRSTRSQQPPSLSAYWSLMTTVAAPSPPSWWSSNSRAWDGTTLAHHPGLKVSCSRLRSIH